MGDMKITVKKLSDLKRPQHNVRIHGDQQIKEYIRSVKMFGQIRPLVIDEDGVVLAGNGLLTALQEMGVEKADCHVVKGLTDAQKKKLMLVDNKIFDLGVNSQQAFDEILKELKGDLDIPGYDPELLRTLSASLGDATGIINDYGKFSGDAVAKMNEQPDEELAPATTGGASTGEDSPAPAQEETTATGDAGAPQGEAEEKEYTAQIETSEDGKKFVICPCCGGKLWL